MAVAADKALLAVSPVVTPTAVDASAAQIVHLISEDELAVGTRLPSERALATQLGVSRPTVSQALRQLSLEGIVEIRRGSGAYVTRRPTLRTLLPRTVDDDDTSIAELAQVRVWLETLAVERACSRRVTLTVDVLDALDSALARLTETVGSTSRWIAADTLFHASIVGAAGNSHLTALYEQVHTAVLRHEFARWVDEDITPDWMSTMTADHHLALHEPILRAVVAGDPDAARRAVWAHHGVMLSHMPDAVDPLGNP